ncbi:MAG TPA: hypothetical protein VJ838_12355 [Gaiellaceae bacterium]|nr:hypothetical protein [Gaiellaceae bacterium]
MTQHRRHRIVLFAVAAMALAAAVFAASASANNSRVASAHPARASAQTAHPVSVTTAGKGKEAALAAAMRTLWDQHMEWTYATVDDFFHNPAAVGPTLDRLLQDQRDIGAAFAVYYGQAAGSELTNLLLTHIEDAVPVLQAAQANDATALANAEAAWFANAKQIADFLTSLNPSNWPASVTEPMMATHISQTITYSVDLLKGDYAQSIVDYDLAESHMDMMADTLTQGIVAQFRKDFPGAESPGAKKAAALAAAMRTLWDQHMEWTYATVDDFFHNPAAVGPTLDRLLQDQRDIGAAFVPFYGQAAGSELTSLLLTHIEEAVPVLQAAQANDATALATAEADWFANAKQIADFLTSLNPTNWPASVTEPMMATHISQTITYSVDLLKGDYTQSIVDYDPAESHMDMMADTLTHGIIAQFPNSFHG